MSESMPNLKSKVEEVLVQFGRDVQEGFWNEPRQTALSALHAILKESMPKERECSECETAYYECGCGSYNLALSEVNEVLDELSRQSEKEK